MSNPHTSSVSCCMGIQPILILRYRHPNPTGLFTLSAAQSSADMREYMRSVNTIVVMNEFDYNRRACICTDPCGYACVH